MKRATPFFRGPIATLRWIIPVLFVLAFLIYETLLEQPILDAYGHAAHLLTEALLYGVTGPLLILAAVIYLDRWLVERHRLERQALANEHRLASIMSASADAILSVDAGGCIESWNLGAELLFGHTLQEVVGQPFTILFGGRPAARKEVDWLLGYVKENGFIRGHETTCCCADGRALTVELTATYLKDDEEEHLGTSVILRDITTYRQRENEIRRLNASLNAQVAERTRELAAKVEELARANGELQKLDQMRSEFISLVSHQIRAPLTNMNGAVQRLQSECRGFTPACARLLAILDEQINWLGRLVQDVLNATHIESGQLVIQAEPMSVLPLVRQVVEQTRARNRGRVIHLPTKPGLPLARADRDRVADVLLNLLDNADKYSPPGLDIAVDVRADQTGVIVSVRDHGPGLPPAELERVFEKFYRTDSSDSQAAYGYGLGLYVCRRLIEAQGGHIWAENHPQGGAVFSFVLPAWQREDG